jgi:hypothetical protein
MSNNYIWFGKRIPEFETHIDLFQEKNCGPYLGIFLFFGPKQLISGHGDMEIKKKTPFCYFGP